MPKTSLTFKIATEPWEFEQIHTLNYRTFVEEIPQHQPNPDQALVDPFHAENTYVICLHGRRLLGMVSVRDRRPFSLDKKLENLDDYLPPHRSVCEFRLLAVLAQQAGRVVDPRALLSAVHQHDYGEKDAQNLVKVHIANLRRKLSDSRSHNPYILCVRGFGYMLERRGRVRQDDPLNALIEE